MLLRTIGALSGFVIFLISLDYENQGFQGFMKVELFGLVVFMFFTMRIISKIPPYE